MDTSYYGGNYPPIGRYVSIDQGDGPPAPQRRDGDGRHDDGKTFKTGEDTSDHGHGGDLRRLGDRGPRWGEVRDLQPSPPGV